MSLSAKAAVSVLRFIKRLGLFPKPGDIDSEISKARIYNQKNPYKEPSDHKAIYSTDHIGGCPMLMIRQKVSSHKKALLFLHGGGNKDAWKPEVSIARGYGKQTSADVFYPIYPPFTEVPVVETIDLIYEFYKAVENKYGAGNIAVVGGSYGGFLAMQLITWINRNGNEVEMPRLLIMNSPFAFPETKEEWTLAEEYEKVDLMVPEGSFKLMMDGVMRADPQTPDYALYPDKMDFRHAPETYIFYAEEACACVSDAIQKAYRRDGAVLHMHKEPGMMHCYACTPVFPESKRDYYKQIELIANMDSTSKAISHRRL
ncbi:MAG: alpha/beta hydrolase fold domain-containing protein [Lachnospiraceae bacterium]|nr:alpha/beta hydrolase fold domain-containing protein [Lachnospiraceae bacterium]